MRVKCELDICKNNKEGICNLKEITIQKYYDSEYGFFNGGEFDIDDSTFVRIGCYGCSGDLITNIVEREEIVYLVFERPMEVWDI